MLPARISDVLEVTEVQRRARLAARHGIAGRCGSVLAAVEQMVCLHATEPASVYLSTFARADASVDDVAHELYVSRTIVRQLAMRRTMFCFPRDLLPAVWGSAASRVAAQLRTRLAKEVESHGLSDRGEAWVEDMCEAVVARLADHGPATTAELREQIPPLDQRIEVSPEKKYGGSFPIAPRLLNVLGATGRVLRGANEGGWNISRHRWTLSQDWLGEPVTPTDSAEGYRVLVERWLRTFGPGTEADLVWWLGATKSAVRQALAELGAVEVGLDEGPGYLLPDDLDELPVPAPWAALLPVLDPTTMGWKQRSFYLDAQDAPRVFDTNGNAGTTAWWDGRVVGCWVQDPEGAVSVRPLHDLGREARQALDSEADRLTRWLAGRRVGTVYPSPLMKY